MHHDYRVFTHFAFGSADPSTVETLIVIVKIVAVMHGVHANAVPIIGRCRSCSAQLQKIAPD